MKLTEEQKKEVYDYIFPVPRYRETFNEVYDHVINALEDREDAFSIELVAYIINNDFAGFSNIVEEEKLYQKKLFKKYAGFFRQEMLNTLKWPNVINNLIIFAICMVFYQFVNRNLSIKILFDALVLIFLSPAVFGITKSWLNRRKFSKDSIIDSFWRFESMFGLSMVNFSTYGFLIKTIFLKWVAKVG